MSASGQVIYTSEINSTHLILNTTESQISCVWMEMSDWDAGEKQFCVSPLEYG